MTSNLNIIAEFLYSDQVPGASAPRLMTTCKQVLQSHVVFSVLVDDVGDFEVVLPKFVVAAAVRERGGEVTHEALAGFDLAAVDAFAYALVHRASMPKPIRAYLLRQAGDEKRLEALRVSAFHFLWGVYRGQ